MPLKSDLPDINIPNIAFHQMFFEEFRKYDNDIALINSATDEQFTFKDLISKSQFVANALLSLGLEKGEVVLICVPNCPEFVWLFLGISLAGGVVSGLHPKFSQDEMRLQVHNSGARIAFVCPTSIESIVAVFEEQIGAAFRIICVGKREEAQGYPIMEDLSFSVPCCSKEFPAIDTQIDLVFLPYSSGTTGSRKGVMLTHRIYNAMLHIFNNPAVYIQPKGGERTIGLLSFCFQFGNQVLFSALYNGATVVTIPEYSSEIFTMLIDTHKVKTQYMSPAILQLLVAKDYKYRYDWSNLENVIVGGAPVGREITMKVLAAHPNILRLLQVYGLTEAGAVCRTQFIENRKPAYGSVGTICANLSVKVIDVISGNELGPNEHGLLLVKGPNIMSGYWSYNEEINEDFLRDGWLDTGDIGYYDDNRNFFIADRLKEMIKVYGFQVTPAELEDILLSHPFVLEAAVVPIENDISGQRPIAYIVLKPQSMTSMESTTESMVTADDIKDYANAKLVYYKQISMVIIAQTLPRSPGGKVLRRLLREAASVHNV